MRPSAFLTSPANNLFGAGGPIGSAELTSLQPETVVYTIAPHQEWSDARPFIGADLVAWWRQARTLASVQSDGYRAIRSLEVSGGGLVVTATFRTPYADWNLLFRDVEARNAPLGCAIGNLLRRPSLGPYRVASASTSRVVLTMNKQWSSDVGRYGRLILISTDAVPSSSVTPFSSYSLTVNRSQEQTLSAHPWLFSHLGTSSSIEEITYAPKRPLTRRPAIREALSLSLNRQSLVDQLWGSVTFSPAVGASAVYSQGQSSYPGTSGGNVSSPPATSTGASAGGSGVALFDCPSCARKVLLAAGYHYGALGWTNAAGGPLAIRVVVGPTSTDRATAKIVTRQWERSGISVQVMYASSDTGAAIAAASNYADAAIFARPTLTTPSYVARSFSGPTYLNVYPSGFTSPAITALYNQAIANFNPVAASNTWLAFDQVIMKMFWVRPLFTSPSLIEWSSNVTGVVDCLSVPGFVDQITSWGSVTATTQ